MIRHATAVCSSCDRASAVESAAEACCHPCTTRWHVVNSRTMDAVRRTLRLVSWWMDRYRLSQQQHQLQLQQLCQPRSTATAVAVAQKAVDGSEGLDLGGRIDYLYGTDLPIPNRSVSPTTTGTTRGTTAALTATHCHRFTSQAAYGDTSVKDGHFFTIIVKKWFKPPATSSTAVSSRSIMLNRSPTPVHWLRTT